MEFSLSGETFLALPERALFAEGHATLFVADLHLGKSDAFRAAGVPLPEGTTEGDLARLDAILARLSVRRLIVLGDLIHCRTGLTDGLVERFADWRASHNDLTVTLVRGNHDRWASRMPDAWRLDAVDEPQIWNGIELRHHPTGAVDAPQLCGHVHPTARLIGVGGQAVRLPCFWLRGERLVLPAFTEFSGGGRIEPAPGDRVFVIADGDVIEAAPSPERGASAPRASA